LEEEADLLTRSVSVNLKGVYLTISWVVDDAILGDSITDSAREVMHVIGEVPLVANLSHNLGRRVKVSGKHHIGWNEKLVGRAICGLAKTQVMIGLNSRVITWTES
jgi:hypothetical protein